MPQDELLPDPDSADAWNKLPQNKPSTEALPPVTGGFPRWLLWMLGAIIVLGVIGALFQGGV